MKIYEVSLDIPMYEDELPADLPQELYDFWFTNSRVDGVRIGPSIKEAHGAQ
jgi:hypothetical protein